MSFCIKITRAITHGHRILERILSEINDGVVIFGIYLFKAAQLITERLGVDISRGTPRDFPSAFKEVNKLASIDLYLF